MNERMLARCFALAPAHGCRAVVHLQQHVDERAALEVDALEPLVEEVEDREQLLLGGRSAAARLGLDPLLRPELLPLLQEGEHELVLGGEVAVERRLRDLGALDQLVDPDRANAPAGEELVGAGENSVARGDGRWSGRWRHPPSVLAISRR
jgi:hypothetical protein